MSSKLRSRIILVAAALLVLGGGYYVARYHAWSAYRDWSINRMNTMARDFIAADDPRSALLTVRKVLRKRPNDVEAWRLGVQAAKLHSSREVVNFQKNLTRVERTPANEIELIRVSLDQGALAFALEAVNDASEETKVLPEYQRMAVQVYRRVNRAPAAKQHLLSLLAVEPDDRNAQLALAEIDFEQEDQRLPADWLQRVKSLSTDVEVGRDASFLLLREAVARKSKDEAWALADRLQVQQDLTIAQRLHVMEAMTLSKPELMREMLAKLKQDSAASPEEVFRVMRFLGARSQHEAIRDWYRDLQESVQKDEQVKLALAQSLHALRDWPELERVLRGQPWVIEEQMRLGLLAYTYRMTGRTADFAESWKLALIATGQDPRKVMRLLQSVQEWRWENEFHDLLWKLFNLIPKNEQIQTQLASREYLAGNTTNLNKIYARVMEVAPEDATARNNFAYTSLLLDTNLSRAYLIARDLFRAHPENLAYRTTYALALHKQGKTSEAYALLQDKDSRAESEPIGRLHLGVYAAASGERELATRSLSGLERMQFLPEERKLVTSAGANIAMQEKIQDKRAQLVGLTGDGSAVGGWLALLPPRAREASLDLQLADSYYRDNKRAELIDLLKGGRWLDDEHLRYALLAYAERKPEDGANVNLHDSWRRAMEMAGRDPRRLNELETLAASWGWVPERMDALGRLFERQAADRERLNQLLEYYRQHGRTADMARVLWLHVKETSAVGPEASLCVYYNLLCGINLSQVQVLARQLYTLAPQEARNRLVYAFALQRQQRAVEAWPLLESLEGETFDGMQMSLLESDVLITLGRAQDAKNALGKVSEASLMPEELTWARALATKLTGPDATAARSVTKL